MPAVTLLQMVPIQPVRGLNLILFDGMLDSSIFCAAEKTKEPPPPLTDVQREMGSVYLNNPYCSDFRLLHTLHKKNCNITMKELQDFKEQFGLNNREVVCSMLMQLVNQHHIQLNRNQASFIEKVKPELRDLDLRQEKPGDLVVYTCLFGRGVKGIGRVYLHLFADMYNGYVFGKATHQRNPIYGVRYLEEELLPFYRSGGLTIKKVLHSSLQPGECTSLITGQDWDRVDIQWVHTFRQIGIYERFQRCLIQADFFERLNCQGYSLPRIQAAFTQWLKEYNYANQVQRRYH